MRDCCPWRSHYWVYGAVWLLIAPVWLNATLYSSLNADSGIALGGLMLIYVGVGYGLARTAGHLFLATAPPCAPWSFQRTVGGVARGAGGCSQAVPPSARGDADATATAPPPNDELARRLAER